MARRMARAVVMVAGMGLLRGGAHGLGHYGLVRHHDSLCGDERRQHHQLHLGLRRP
jgi:hypothetical protein